MDWKKAMTISPTGMTARIPESSGGFTLIELVFVMCLFVTLTALAMPQFSRSWKSRASQNGAEELLALMTLARERAIMEGVDYAVSLDDRRNLFWMVRQEGRDTLGSWQRVPGKWGQSRALPTNLTLRDDSTLAVFHPDGTAGPFSLEMHSPDGSSLAVRVDPVLGKGTVEIHERA
jgi:type II secretory pathway pseudopilin PulG